MTKDVLMSFNLSLIMSFNGCRQVLWSHSFLLANTPTEGLKNLYLENIYWVSTVLQELKPTG